MYIYIYPNIHVHIRTIAMVRAFLVGWFVSHVYIHIYTHIQLSHVAFSGAQGPCRDGS